MPCTNILSAIYLVLLTNQQIAKALMDWHEYVSEYALDSSIFRSIGWALIKLIGGLCSGLETSLTYITAQLGTLVANTTLLSFMANLHPVLKSCIAIGVMALGFAVMFRKKDTNINIAQVIVLLTLVIAGMPMLLSLSSQFTSAAIGSVGKAREASGISPASSAQIVANGLVDLRLVAAENGFSQPPIDYRASHGGRLNELPIAAGKADLSLIAINEVLYAESKVWGNGFPGISNDVLEKKLVWIGATEATSTPDYSVNGVNYSLADLKDHGIAVTLGVKAKPGYYRYHVDWFQVIISLVPLFLVLAFTAIKQAMVMVEIVFGALLLPFIAPFDLAGGQRMKEGLRHLVTLFAVFFFLSILLTGYLIIIGQLNAWYNDFQDSSSAFGFSAGGLGVTATTYIIIQIGAAIVMVGGPEIATKLLGVDLGVKSAMGVYIGMRGVNAVVKRPFTAGGSVAKFASAVSERSGRTANRQAKRNIRVSDAEERMRRERSDSAPGSARGASAGSMGANTDAAKAGAAGSRRPGTETNMADSPSASGGGDAMGSSREKSAAAAGRGTGAAAGAESRGTSKRVSGLRESASRNSYASRSPKTSASSTDRNRNNNNSSRSAGASGSIPAKPPKIDMEAARRYRSQQHLNTKPTSNASAKPQAGAAPRKPSGGQKRKPDKK